jgi:hypothetical protein
MLLMLMVLLLPRVPHLLLQGLHQQQQQQRWRHQRQLPHH